jgi:predicted esterase
MNLKMSVQAAFLLLLTGASSGCLQSVLPIRRADLGFAYVEFERALRDHPPLGSRVAEVNRSFDRATVAFFAARYGDAIEQLQSLTLSLTSMGAATPEQKLLASLKVWIDPAVRAVSSAEAPVVRVGSMYPVTFGETRQVSLTLRIRNAVGRVAVETPFSASAGWLTRIDEVLTLSGLSDERLPPGRCEVEIALIGTGAAVKRPWYVAPRSLDRVRRENAARLERLTVDGAALQQAVEICQARNRLLRDVPSEIESAEFLADPIKLMSEVGSEIRLLGEGRNPYENRSGETWRIIPTAGDPVPMWLYAPAAVSADAARQRPLVVALHGAGVGERMFLEGYGAGVLKRLADEHGFIVACPQTDPFLRMPGVFSELVDSLSRDYAIDRRRMYVVGHSLGGVAAGLLAGREAARIAAACCIAGGGDWQQHETLAPTLVVLGELDPINNGAAARRDVERARDKGLPIELRDIQHYGHTLIVGHVLPEVVAWLLAREQRP